MTIQTSKVTGFKSYETVIFWNELTISQYKTIDHWPKMNWAIGTLK